MSERLVSTRSEREIEDEQNHEDFYHCIYLFFKKIIDYI